MPLNSTLESGTFAALLRRGLARHCHGGTVSRMYWSTAVIDYLACAGTTPLLPRHARTW